MMISLIVTTTESLSENLIRLIKSLEIQSYKNFELIIIYQSSDKIIHHFVNQTSIVEKIKILYYEKTSLSKARNIGLGLINGEIIGFPDDDCWYNQDLLMSIFDKFNSNQRVSCYCTNVYDPIKDRLYGKRRKKHNKDLNVNLINVFKYPISVGIFVNRVGLCDIFFDEELGAGSIFGSGEETDMILKLLKKNQKVVYSSSIDVYHEVPSETTWNIKKYFNYGRGFGATVKKALLRKQYLILIEFINIYLRTIFAIILFYFYDKEKHKIYLSRLKGIKEGFSYKK